MPCIFAMCLRPDLDDVMSTCSSTSSSVGRMCRGVSRLHFDDSSSSSSLSLCSGVGRMTITLIGMSCKCLSLSLSVDDCFEMVLDDENEQDSVCNDLARRSVCHDNSHRGDLARGSVCHESIASVRSSIHSRIPSTAVSHRNDQKQSKIVSQWANLVNPKRATLKALNMFQNIKYVVDTFVWENVLYFSNHYDGPFENQTECPAEVR